MITRREDLHNTWVDVTKDHGVVKLFVSIYDKDALFGNEIIKPYDEVGSRDCVAISVDSRGGWAKHTDKPFHPTLREVVMADFIPLNDVKYFDKDEEIKPQDGFVSNSKEERMINGNAITYATFQNAKICNPDSDIYLLASGKYSTKKSKSYGDKIVAKCDPRYYCINGFEFANRGYSLEVGDSVLVEGRAYIELTKCGVSLVTKANQKELLIIKSKQMNESRKDNYLMSDNKVLRTKTEYVRVTDSIFDLKDELNDGKLYFQNETTDYVFISVNDELILTKELKRGNIYRKVNRIATWKDCVLDFIEIDCGGLNSSEVCDFWFIMNKKPEFVIKLSHLIASMTDKPEL